MRNLKEITPILVGIELGQDLYIPDYANNPLMLFKKNCPIWIKINEDGDCIVHPISDEENWEDEIDAVIRENIEKDKWVIYAPLSDEYKKALKIKTNDDYNLSCVAIDGYGKIKAAIIIDKDSDGRMIIRKIIGSEQKHIGLLATHIRVSKDNLDKYKSQLLWYSPHKDDNYSGLLGMVKNENGDYFWQFE